ncbi:MAG: hypothetical protein CVT68_02940 [Actinobacteria bacterium HGW-Actinobacteria-8]|nr:MAG: hypothetical protein CVT68_02940 [Actinobacteria bacterium HGW-Actinobacteria-8]
MDSHTFGFEFLQASRDVPDQQKSIKPTCDRRKVGARDGGNPVIPVRGTVVVAARPPAVAVSAGHVHLFSTGDSS